MNKTEPLSCISADWPAPDGVRALTTTRLGGFSQGSYRSFNLAMHVGDDRHNVTRNRDRLIAALRLPSSPLWLEQVHGEQLINAANWQPGITADACYTKDSGLVCTVLTADCLPLLLCHGKASCVAAVHLGWRGICSPLLDRTIAAMGDEPEQLLAWIGPHIHAGNYEVGNDVREACLELSADSALAFTRRSENRWLASLSTLVESRLKKLGVTRLYASDRCVYDDIDHFYSYRREKVSGRMASLIWMET